MSLSFSLLCSGNLEKSLNALGLIFPDDFEVAKRHYKEFVDKNNPVWNDHRFWEYYIAKDENNDVVAITGLYNRLKDNTENEVWLGWYGVVPKFRNVGFGKSVLDWTINKARELGYKKFRLWTTTDQGEINAQKLYEKLGLKIYKREKFENTEFEKLYREINL